MAGALACFACESPEAPEACGTIPDQVVHVGETATVRACFDDPNGDRLLYSVTVSQPGVVSATAATSTLTITGRTPGNSMVSVTAIDAGGLMAEARFQVMVPNRSPAAVGTIAPLEVSAGGSVAVDVSAYFSDPDGQELSYAALSSDTSVAAVAGVGAVFTVVARAKGDATVTVTASDPGGLSATQAFALTVPNRGPFVVDSIPERTLEVGETVAQGVAAYFGDPDGDPLSFGASASDPRLVTVSVTDSTVSVTALRKGAATVTVTATDTEGLAATLDFAVTVPNQPPVTVGAVPADSVPVGEFRQLDAPSLFSDPDGDTLMFAATSSDSTVVTAAVAGGAVTVAAIAKGEATLTVTATDTEGLTAAQTFAVTAPNRAPTAEQAIPPRTIEVGDSAVLELSPFFSDPDGDPLVYEAAASDASMMLASVTGTALTITAIAKGETTLTVTATDTEGLATTQTFAVTVPNRAPRAEGTIPSWDAEPGDTAQVDLAPYFRDPDGDHLVFTAGTSDSATVDVGVSGAAMAIAALARGEATVRVTATDADGLTAAQSLAITVRNRPPLSVGSIENHAVEVGESTTLVLSPFFSDPDADPLTFAAISSDSTVVQVSLDGTAMTLAAIAKGEATVTITAADAAGLAATQMFSVTVPNRAPVAIGTLQVLRMNQSAVKRLTPQPHFADPDDDSLVFEAASSDPNVARAWVSGDYVLVRAVGGGAATVTIVGRDPEGLSAEQEVVVRVRGSGESDPNRPPVVVGGIGGQTMEEGDFRTLVVGSHFSDPDHDKLHLSAASSDTAVATARMSDDEVVLRAMAPGDARLGITARDPGGLTATLEFTVTVSEASGINRAPVAVSAVTAKRLSEGDSTTFNAVAYFVDPDNDGLTFTATSSDPAVVASTVSGSEVVLRAVAPGNATIGITARDPGGLAATLDFDVTVFEPGDPAPICDRTPAVRREILALVGDSDCAEVTSGQLGLITRLELQNKGIASLKSGDFSGLTRLDKLWLYGNRLSQLPAGVFSGLSRLISLDLSHNNLTTLPPGAFSDAAGLYYINIASNRLTELPSSVFSGLSSLKFLYLGGNDIGALPSGIFSGLSSLEVLDLYGNEFSTIPTGIFSDLASLRWLYLDSGALTTLAAGTFEGLSGLRTLNLSYSSLSTLPPSIFSGVPNLNELVLSGNDLGELPDGVFHGLSSLAVLWLHGNKVEPMPIEVSLVSTASGDVKATVPVGAPFAIEVPVTVTGGAIDGVITIPVGAVESASWDADGATTVDIVTLPDLPSAEEYLTHHFERHPVHHGYILKKSPDLPLTLGEEDAIQDEVFSLSPYATSIPSSRNTSWIRFSSLTPSAIGRWNALRPEISPMPPARLLITAVRAACAKSLSPLEPPELISPARPM